MSKTWTPEDMEAAAKFLDIIAKHPESRMGRAAAMLRQAAASERRWAALKAWGQDWQRAMLDEMARLEREQ